jgi:MoaA/NifB/PqqE/SkfB family radical SAM enzyme
MHGTEEGFEKVKSFLRFFKEKPFRKRPRLTMVNVMNKNNIAQADKMVEFAQSYCDRIYFWYLIAIKGLQPLAVSKCQAVDFLKKAKTFKKNIGIKNNLKEFIFHLTYYTFVFERTNHPIHFRLPCYIGWFYSRVDANANVRPCCGKKAFLGNIRQDDFKDIWRCNQYDDFRKNACQLKKDPRWYDKYCFYFCSTFRYINFINCITHPRLYLKAKIAAHFAVKKAVNTNYSYF